MMTTAASTATDRSDFRTVMIAGTKTGALIALAVVVFLAATRVLGPGGGPGGRPARRPGVPPPRPPPASLPPPWRVRAPPEASRGAPRTGRGGRTDSGGSDSRRSV